MTVSTVAALGLAVVDLPAGRAAAGAVALRASAGVERVELDRGRAVQAVSTDPRYAEQWSLPKIGWPSVSVPVSGKAIVAILDTGVDAAHPDLAGRLVPGVSFVGGDALTDPNGHGTWMAGIVAAATGNGKGIAGIGSAGVRVMPVRVLGAAGTGWDSDIISGILYAADNGADVILLAFSAPGYSAALQSAIDYAWGKGAVIVAAAGNDGSSTPTYPAGDRGVMGVSNTNRSDELSATSNFGSTVFLGAPGTEILTTGLGGTYRSVSGTSAAAAEVAASAAVLIAIDPPAANAIIVGRLARSAAKVGNRGQTGNGRLDLGQAVLDRGTEKIEPSGVAGRADGGPFVGPYVAAAIGDFRSAASGNWATAATWQRWNGASWATPAAGPTSSDGVITILSGHTVTIGASVTVDEVVVDSGGQITLSSGFTLTLANGAGTDLSVTGILRSAGTVTINASATIVFNSGGRYQHNFTTVAGVVPTATWSTGSTLEVIGYTTYAGGATGIGFLQSFANVVWNSASQSSVFSLAGELRTVNGNLTVTTTGSGTLSLGASGAGNLALGGNYSQTGGTFRGSATAARTMTVGGNFSLSTGTFDLSSSATAGNAVTVNVAGDFSHSGGTLTETGATTGSGVVFNGSGTQTYTSGGTVSNIVAFTVNSGATLQMAAGTTIVSGGGAFTLATGGGLGITSTAGITSSGATGNIQVTGARTFSTSANYSYNGTSGQVTGNGLPATVNNLTADNAAGVTLTAGETVAGVLGLTNGTLTPGANTLYVNSTGSVARTNGWVVGNLKKNVATGVTSRTFEVGDASSYAPASVSFASVTTQGDLTVSTTAGDQPNIGTSAFNAARTANRHWTLANAGVVFTTYAATFTFVAGDVDAGATPSAFAVGRFAAATWSYTAPDSTTSTSTTASGFAAFGDFQVGQVPPTVTFTVPAAGTTLQTATSVNVTWSETAPAAPISTRSLQRQKGAVVTGGTCAGVTFANDGTADTNVSPRNNSSLTSGQCYRWTQTLTDTLANSATAISGAVLVNGAPTAVADTYATNEDTALVVPVTGSPYNGVLYNDSDPDLDAITAVLVTNVATGTLSLASNGSFTYTPVADANGAVTFTYKANDGTNDSNTVTVTLTITAVNDAPVNSVPGQQLTTRNTSLVFSSGNGNLISITDTDAGSSAVQLQLTATNGTLTLSGTTGLTFSVGDGTADVTMTFTGSMSAVNTAIAGLSFAPTLDYGGPATVQLVTNDQGNTGSGGAKTDTDTVTIAVAESVGFQAEDYIAGSSTGAGFINGNEVAALGGQAITTNGDNIGVAPPAERVRYSVNFPSVGGGTNTYHLYVRYRLAIVQYEDDSAWALAPLDADASVAASWDRINNLRDHGATTYRWIDLTSNATAGLDLVAAFTNVSAGNHAWWFGGRENGFYADAFVFSTGFNLDLTAAGQAHLDASVNDRPVVTTTVVNLAYTENAGALALDAGITVSDIDSANLASATVTMTTNYVNGQDSLAFSTQNGISATWTAATGVLALTGSATVVNYQTALRSITYTNASDAPSTLSRTVTFVANDGTASSTTASRGITVTAVNDPPAGTNKTVTTNEDMGYVFTTADVGFSDALDGGANTLLAVKITTLPAAGSLTLSGSAVSAAQFVSAADITAGLLAFSPAANANGSGYANFTFQVQDNGGTANGGVDLDQSPNTITVDVTAVNDAPSFTKGADQTVPQNSGVQSVSGWATTLSTGPADESGQALDFVVSNTNNALFSAQPAIGATGTLTYTLAPDIAGVATVTAQIHDNGGSANGGLDTSPAQTFAITVGDGAFTPTTGWATVFDTSRYLTLTFPAYVPAGSVVTAATFRHEYRSATAGDTTCYYFEVYSGATLLATHGTAVSPVSCNATSSYALDAIALPEVDTVAKANTVTVKLFVRNSGSRGSQHRTATLGVVSSLD